MKELSVANVSVIVVNYNCFATLKDCIESILLSKGVGELILIDNASTDGSMALLRNFNDSRLKIIRLSRNIGLAGARNLAALKTRSQYIAFVDADSKVDSEWLQEPCSLLGMHQELGAVQCRILGWRRKERIAEEFLDFNCHEFSDLRKEGIDSYNNILFPIGAGFVIRRDAWNLVKGFDPFFFVGHDDIDLGIRLWLSGYYIVRSCKGVVYHDGGTLRGRRDIAPIFAFYGTKNLLSMWVKDLQGKTLVKQVLPFLLLYPFMALWRAGLIGLNAIISSIHDFPSLLRRRQEVQLTRKAGDEKISSMLQPILPIQQFAQDFIVFHRYISRKFGSVARKF